MAVQATYDLRVDWANDGSFATQGDNVSDLLMFAQIDGGFSSPLARFAMPRRAVFVIRDLNGAYSPANNADALPYRPVRFRMTYSSTVVLFRGFISRISPAPGQFGPRRTMLECIDATELLDLFQGNIELQVGAFADGIIDDVVDDVYTPPSTNYEDGLNFFPTSGEKWSLNQVRLELSGKGITEEIRASNKIIDACASDWGRFFIAKDGAPTFFNRWHMPLSGSPDLTLNDDMQGMNYETHATEVFNIVTVTYLPRTVGDEPEVIGQFAPERVVQIKPLATDTYTIWYKDPSNSEIQIGGLNVVTPVSGTDYKATDDDAGEGNDVSANLNITFVPYADHAEVEIENTDNTTDAFIQFFRVRGQAVRTRRAESITASDSSSISSYGQRRLNVNAPLMSNSAQAQSLADYLLDVYKDPHDILTNITINGNRSDTFMQAVRDLDLMSKVRITESHTGLSAFDGHVFYMRHTINSKFEHWLEFALETPYEVGNPFILGDALNSGHVLIY